MISGRTLLARLNRLSPAPGASRIPQVDAHLIQIRHYVKGVRRDPRTKLSPYKLDLRNLPSLTEPLTRDSDFSPSLSTSEKLAELWREKLETYKAFLPMDQKPVLLEALFNPHNDIDKLLRIIDDNLTTMTSFYVAVSFEALDDKMRHNQCDIDTVIASPELKRLCTRALYKIRFFEADEVLKLLKCLATIHLPEDMLLSQAAFQMARHLINDYNIEELEALDKCLSSFVIIDQSKKSLLLAVKEAIPAMKQNLIKQNQHTQLESKSSLVEKNEQN